MKKKIILLSVLFLGIVALSVSMIRAWLTDTNTTGPVNMTVGNVKFTFTGALISTEENEWIIPGQNIVDTAFQITNASNIGTELRLKLDITYDTDTDATSLMVFNLDTNKWVLDGDYYYFRDAMIVDSTSQSGKYIIPSGTQVIPILSNISLDGSKVDNAFSGKTFTITITFEAKQSDYVTWEELGSIALETGN